MLNDRAIVGFAVSNVLGNVKYKDSKKGDKVQSSSWMFTGYGSYNLDQNWFVRGALIAGSNAITSKEKRN
jgi:hypothetical protein